MASKSTASKTTTEEPPALTKEQKKLIDRIAEKIKTDKNLSKNLQQVAPDELQMNLSDAIEGAVKALDNDEWEKKYKHIEETEQRWEEFHTEDAEYLLVSYGTTGRICKSTVLNARKKGIKLGLIRPITLWPFPKKAFPEIIDNLKGIVTVELNTGQMIEDVRLATECKKPVHLFRRQGGMLPTEHEILDFVAETFNLTDKEA